MKVNKKYVNLMYIFITYTFKSKHEGPEMVKQDEILVEHEQSGYTYFFLQWCHK